MALGTLPSEVRMPALVETPIRVPTVSNISTNRKVIRTISMSREKIRANSNWKKIGPREGGAEKSRKPSRLVTPRGMLTIVEARIPQSRAPLTLKASMTPVMTRPIMATTSLPNFLIT